MTMNLFHCSDDPFSTVREFLIYRSENELRDALSGPRTTKPIEKLQKLQMLQPATNFDPDISARRIAARLLINSGWEDLGDALLVLPAGDESMRDRLLETHRLFSGIKASLAERAGGRSGQTEANLPFRFLAFPYIRDVEMARLIREMEAFDIRISDWEALALVSTCHYVAGELESLKNDE